jgi:hypothetical protein
MKKQTEVRHERDEKISKLKQKENKKGRNIGNIVSLYLM